MSQPDDQGRSESSPQGPGGQYYGQPPQYGQPTQQYGQPTQQQYGPGYGQQYGTPTPYGQPEYGYPQQPYGQPYGQYGQSSTPAKPAPVIVSAVLGFVFGAFGVLATLGVLIGGVALFSLAGSIDSAGADPFADLGSDAAAGVGIGIVVVGLLALAWTIVMIWGSVWALTGRSRVLLLVGGSIAIAATLFSLLASMADNGPDQAAGVVVSLLFLMGAVAVVVLLCIRPAAHFFAEHRARRSRP